MGCWQCCPLWWARPALRVQAEQLYRILRQEVTTFRCWAEDLLCIIRLTILDQVTKAIIGKPAPAFSGTSVLNGEFKELKLSDYLGNFLHFVLYFKLSFLQESTWFSFSTHWTSPLSVPPRSSPSTTGWKSSGHLVLRLVLVLVDHTGRCMPNSRW